MRPVPDSISWEVTPFSWTAADRLARVLRLPFPVATVLVGRGFVDPDEAQAFLDCTAEIPDPFLFADMQAAVASLVAAIEGRSRVVVHGDYDADGITATAVMALGLRDFGLQAECYLPSRFTDGFGLSARAVETIAEAGPALLITVDCGVNYPAEVSLARDLGLDVIVVDHHQPGPVLPSCALIHPVRGEYPTSDLCGVGLAFKLLHALHVRLRGASVETVPDALHPLLDLVAVGTIADLAPLRGENRYYAKEGLKLLTIGSRPGLRALSKVAGCQGSVDSGAVSFRLAPRLNAAGRLGDAYPPLRLLLTDDEAEGLAIAEQLHELNGARQDVERGILDEAVAQVETLDSLPPALVLSGEGWHEGVVGIVASRLVERYHRPVILLGEHDGVAKGSGRSIAPYDLMSGLNACADRLSMFGGHTQAVGLTLPATDVTWFRQALQEHAGSVLCPDDLRPVYHADAVLRGDDINADTAQALAALGPFGSGNPRPRLMLVDACLRQVEVTRNGPHLRCVVEVDGVKARAIGFGMAAQADELREDGSGRVLGVQLRVDEWQGALRPEFQLDRIGPGGPHAAVSPPCGPDCTYHGVHTDARCSALPPSDGGARHAVRASAPGAQPGGAVASTQRLRRDQARGTAPLLLPPRAGRDLRGQRGRLTALAQVLSSGASTLVLACSVAACLDELAALPLCDLTRGRLQCVGQACGGGALQQIDPRGVLLAEWDVAWDDPGVAALVDGREHVVALDPPYRHGHVALVERAIDTGAQVHLYYGDDQRHTTAKLLRYLVHPRFAMVCMYRALRQGTMGGDVRRMAAELAWREGRVALRPEALALAGEVLAGLDLDQTPGGEAKMDLDSVPAYAQAAADYEECSRLCRIL